MVKKTYRYFLYFTLTLFLIINYGCAPSPKNVWITPYSDVNWKTVKQIKAQFHTHTTRSDGRLSPQLLIDKYYEQGYEILAITDHWLNTWPWTDLESLEISATTKKRVNEGEFDSYIEKDYLIYENRDPKELGMVAILGSEPSWRGRGKHHMVSLFTDITGTDMTMEEALDAAEEKDGLFSFAHPGRSVERDNNDPEDYINFFKRYSCIYGIDIFNRATYREPERFPYSQNLIASILDDFGSPDNPEWRPLWFTSTDDTHSPSKSHIDRAYQIQLIDELSEESVHKSLKDGTFFWVAKGLDAEVPIIESIDVKKETIAVQGTGFEKIVWYSGDKAIYTGESFNLKEFRSDNLIYVYFIAYSADFSLEGETGAMVGSQPFWVLN